ncbi:MAG: hypothetical protein D3923_17400, partial [Candidatus Electrothrix sp. AR3]|nr:hypothetical protein [Candidatus Electrothrix sp. AR3]
MKSSSRIKLWQFNISVIIVLPMLWTSPSYGWWSIAGNGYSTHQRLSNATLDALLDWDEYPDLIMHREIIIDATYTRDNDAAAHEGAANNDGPAEKWWTNALIQYNGLNFSGNPNGSYWYIGQLLHLVQDMGVPAHAFDIPHWDPPWTLYDYLEYYSSGVDYTDGTVTPKQIAFQFPYSYRGSETAGLKGYTKDIVNTDKLAPPTGKTWNDYWVDGLYGKNNKDIFSLDSSQEKMFRSYCLSNARDYGAGALQLASK